MNRFDQCLSFVLEREGGYVNRREDRGGATNKGVTQSTYDAYRKDKNLPLQSVKFLTEFETSDIYRSRYWSASGCDKLPRPVDLVIFDGAVNHGGKRSIKFLQKAVLEAEDGVIGPKTLSSVAEECRLCSAVDLAKRVIDYRREFYKWIVSNDESQRVFLNGWMNRMQHLEDEIS